MKASNATGVLMPRDASPEHIVSCHVDPLVNFISSIASQLTPASQKYSEGPSTGGTHCLARGTAGC